MYPELVKLMAFKKIRQKELAKAIGISQQALSKKLLGQTDFKRGEMKRVKEYFSDICPDVTMDQIFRQDIFLPA